MEMNLLIQISVCTQHSAVHTFVTYFKIQNASMIEKIVQTIFW